MRGRFIADNRLLMKLTMDHCSQTCSEAVGLLLDQEKAYDRVHPDYLQQVLERVSIPSTFVHLVCSLFFGTRFQININRFFSAPIAQKCGLRQSDPLSPVLFNLAFEPFLRSVFLDLQFKRVSLPVVSPAPSMLPPVSSSVKLLAYADDVVRLLQDPDDLQYFLTRFDNYSRVSIALLACSKTQVISLSGSSTIYTDIWRPHLLSRNIRTWHDHTSRIPSYTLAFLFTTPSLKETFLNKLFSKVSTACKIHSQCSLSVRSRATMVNTLILSTL
ncbi:hypothetical protein G6F56_001704 [Rhizopus delemar]|nr:hypothetical protein G6F56_001704 [Rhizopus delemar]